MWSVWPKSWVLSRLLKKGRIVRVGKGVYALAKNGLINAVLNSRNSTFSVSNDGEEVLCCDNEGEC